MEIVVSRGDDEQVLALEGRWREKGGGWLQARLRGLILTPAEPGQQPVAGSAAVQVQRLLRAPLQVRRIELDLRFAGSYLRVRNSPSLGIQFFGLTVPGTLSALSPGGAQGENVDVRIHWDQVRNLAMNLVFAPPDRPDQP